MVARRDNDGEIGVRHRVFPFRHMTWLIAIAALMAVGAAAAQQPITARSVVAGLDALKQTYEVRDFRLGGKYDLNRPQAWDRGGEGGVTLESLGAKPARTSYIAVGTPKRDAKG